jgi:hypothetical protein
MYALVAPTAQSLFARELLCASACLESVCSLARCLGSPLRVRCKKKGSLRCPCDATADAMFVSVQLGCLQHELNQHGALCVRKQFLDYEENTRYSLKNVF